ncbi:amidohydrolase family protein [uncultured Paludibaculum sp.]|uniref:amidohydrolase family protein n=1 Tax=uncultured Paludibaculum sp. TaxID=1765020 RepID=UPI002AAAB6F8|nr:amidohydrolase family protein [uncultured Paludibaculum sp.]
MRPVVLVIAAVSLCGQSPNGRAESPRLLAPIRHEVFDGHLHFFDFVQETPGMDALFKAMDNAGVTDAVISGMPLVKTWDEGDARRPTYYMENDSRAYWYSATDFLLARAILELPSDKQSRLHPFICGFNSADRNGVDHVERMLALYPGFWQGIGEVFLRHDDLTALTYGETPRATSKAFGRLLELAAKHDLPVLVHSNIGPSWRQMPDYLDEIESAIRRYPDTRLIWAHAGISRRIVIADHTAILRRLLGQYPNLSIDLSWVIFEQEIAPGGTLDRAWVNLIEEYSGRFMIGSDTSDFSERYKSIVQRSYVLLDALKPETARKVARDNLLSLLPGSRSVAKGAR